MALIAEGLRREMFGEGSFAESVLGRITLVVLFTTVVGLVLFMLFLINRVVAPVVLKYAVVAAVGLGAGFNTRSMFPERSAIFRVLTAFFAIFISLGVLNVFSRGFIGLNLLRAYPSLTPWEGPISFGLAAVCAWLALRGWSGSAREIIVEPRAQSAPVTIVEPAPRTRQTRRAPGSFASSLTSLRDRTIARLSALAPAPRRTTTKRRKPAKTKTRRATRPVRRSAGVHLSGEVEHMCPYCLEPVVKNDRRGVKVCKVCKTWHHADCWAITGVCQVPHQYVN